MYDSHEPSLNPRRALTLLAYPLFFASGAAGLIYEVVWTRILLATFGAGLYAVCAVLAAFMAGLALGSWVFGRISDRFVRPLRVYAILELLIGLCGACLPLLLTRVGAIDQWAYNTFGQNFALLTSVRFIVAFAIMLVPTTLMGATLPILSKFMVRTPEHLGLHVGWLYAINTLGALAGAFAAGFVLIGEFGLHQTEWIAAGLNLSVAILSLVLSAAAEKTPATSNAPGIPLGTATEAAARRRPASEAEVYAPSDARWVLLTAFVSGMVALAAQVLWSRSLVFSFEYLKNTTYAFSAMLTVFLAGLAIGSALIGLFIDHQRQSLRLYGILLTLIGMAILASVSMLYYGADALKLGDPFNATTQLLDWNTAVGNVMLQTFGVLGIPTLLMGMAFPVAARVVVSIERIGSDVGRLYSVNTVGAILGSVLAGFVIVPLLGLTNGLIALGAIDMLLGLLTMRRAPAARLHLRMFGGLALVMLIMVFFGLPRDRGLQPLTSENDEIVFYEEGPLATVAVLETNLDYRTIFVDSVGVAGTDPILQTDQKSLAHMPMMLVKDASAALTVGFGSGGASYSLLQYDALEKPHCVEICSTVFNAAPHLLGSNHGFFGSLDPLAFAQSDPRYEIILDDARAYLRYTDQHYDFISTDCTDLRYKSNANLYDLEYFQACRDRLTDDGIVCVWMPLGGLSRDMFRVALRTFHKVFPQMAVFYMSNVPTHYCLLIGWQDQISLDYELFAQRLREDDVRADLGELYLDDPIKLISCFITGGDPLGVYLAGEDLNTQNNPVLEFESPKYGYFDQPVADNLADIMAPGVRVSPREFLNMETIPPAELERLERYEQALPHIIKGHAAYRDIKIEEATREYMQALAIAPEDLSVRRGLLPLPDLRDRAQREPNNPFPFLWLGRSEMLQGNVDAAYDLLRRAEALFVARAEASPSEFDHPQLEQVRRWLVELREQARQAPEL